MANLLEQTNTPSNSSMGSLSGGGIEELKQTLKSRNPQAFAEFEVSLEKFKNLSLGQSKDEVMKMKSAVNRISKIFHLANSGQGQAADTAKQMIESGEVQDALSIIGLKPTDVDTRYKRLGFMSGALQFEEALKEAGLQKSTKATTEKEVLTQAKIVNNIDRVLKDFDKELFTLGAKVQAKAGNILTFLSTSGDLEDSSFGQIFGESGPLGDIAKNAGMSPKKLTKRVGQLTELRSRVSQVFQPLRKEITGAQAALQELDRLQDELLRMDGITSAPKFLAQAKTLADTYVKTIELEKKFRSQGFNFELPEVQARFNKIFNEEIIPSSLSKPPTEQAVSDPVDINKLSRPERIKLLLDRGVDTQELLNRGVTQKELDQLSE